MIQLLTRSILSFLFLRPPYIYSSLLQMQGAGTEDCGGDACAGADFPSACCEELGIVMGWNEVSAW